MPPYAFVAAPLFHSGVSLRPQTAATTRPQHLFSTPFSPYQRPSPPRPRPAHRLATKCGMADKRPAAIRFPATGTPPWEKLAASSIPVDYANGAICTTPTKVKESLRLFGQKEADVRVVLYRDHAHWCPYCHKVQMLIEAKRIPYLIKKVNMSCYGAKPEEFLKLVPTGLLPVILLDGKVITESMDIMFLLEDTFQTPYRKMIPTDDNDMMQAFHRYMRLERIFIGAWLGCLRGPMSMLGRGMDPVHHTLDLIDSCLGEFAGPFFYPGDEPSFVDINFATIFERSRSALKYWRNLEMTEGRRNLKNWFDAWERWEPSLYLRSDDWTHIGALPPQIGPVRFCKTRNAVSLAVETQRTLHVLNDGPEGKMPRNMAASAICRNHKIVVNDAIRGVKVPEADHMHVDNALRIISQVLFNPDLLEILEERARKEIPKGSWEIVGNAIRFERARCCAPRDMPIRSMEQFCGAINWLLQTLEQVL